MYLRVGPVQTIEHAGTLRRKLMSKRVSKTLSILTPARLVLELTLKRQAPGRVVFVCWLLNVPATGKCISDGSAQTILRACHTEVEAADQTFYLTQSQYTDTGLTSPSVDPITPGTCQGSHWSANILSHWYDSTPKNTVESTALEADALNH